MSPATPLPTPEHIDSEVYLELLPSVSENENEVARLDAMHHALHEYFDGGLCVFQLQDERPQRILELGCGSGAWYYAVSISALSCSFRAIQAAIDFPEAQVIAVDISPLPAHRVLPDNMVFELLDLRENLPFERESFDIVHARMVMMHVPNAKDLVKRVAQLVKSGGLLLLDDVDNKTWSDTAGPAVRPCVDKLMELWKMSGAEPELGRKFQYILAETSWFSEIQVEKIAIPLGGCIHDERLNKLGLISKLFLQRFVMVAGARLAGEGLTEEMVQSCVKELDQVGCTAVWDFYSCAARRGVLAELDAQEY
ncbi:S-adenosyl-L-methionine-dependent methyltransferase [Roridomyces roridus]|uniref:S-adenosyl-L-methionine-dependent methyltransferase n=1 Tax=Roridomyces roridus TaxID=1738132 RepID=A0AAD7BXT6_9AGAR|nr:S-adenosyl-L-methionine-dependent methyltransferase [Roridomyces roridus]